MSVLFIRRLLLFFLRHGATQKDSNFPISQWILSEKGQEQANKLVQQNMFDDVDIIYS